MEHGDSAGWLARALVRAAPEAIVVTGPDGIIRLWNQGAERLFGHPEAAAIGRRLDLIIPEKLRAAHWEGFDKTMATGQTRYGDTLLKVPALHADGRRLSIEFSVALLRGDDGQVTAISAIIRDATQRWNDDRARAAAERELRARVAELEERLACWASSDGSAGSAGAPGPAEHAGQGQRAHAGIGDHRGRLA